MIPPGCASNTTSTPANRTIRKSHTQLSIFRKKKKSTLYKGYMFYILYAQKNQIPLPWQFDKMI